MGLGTLRRHRRSTPPNAQESATPIPEDFPGRGALLAAGYATLEDLRSLSEADLIAIRGIGPKLAQQILEALQALEAE
jgi:predicted flap endonuclease-1-like 5' DNA nuclease